MQRGGTPHEAWKAQCDAANDAMEKLAASEGGRRRIAPKSSSKLVPSDENPTDADVRPDFDRSIMEGYGPDAPFSQQTSDED